MTIEPVIIVGAGPAGLATALQLQRYHIKARLLERNQPGGLLWNANWVENYPGFPQGISGPDLVQLFLEQAQLGGITVTHSQVYTIDWEDNLFQVTASHKIYRSPMLVIASGTKPKKLRDIPIPTGLLPFIFYEIVPLLRQKDKRVVIVGGGDAAFDYALNLGRQNSVIILNRSQQAQCLPLLWERANASQYITYRSDAAITRLSASELGGMIVECSSPQGLATLEADYLIIAIGREPELDFVSTSLLEQSPDLEKRGILHFVGDIKNDIFRQTSIAIGDGIRAGMSIYKTMMESYNETDRLNRQRRHRHRLHR